MAVEKLAASKLPSAAEMRTATGLPNTTTDNAVARFDGTGGAMQNSAFVVDDTGHVTSFGGNIKFPGTMVPSANANTLDDYEEGTFTAALGENAGSNYTLSTSDCRYTKVGRLVTCEILLIWTSIGAVGAGRLCVKSMPFAAGAGRSPGSFGFCAGLDTQSLQLVGLMVSSETEVRLLRLVDNSNGTDVLSNTSGATGEFQFGITYST